MEININIILLCVGILIISLILNVALLKKIKKDEKIVLYKRLVKVLFLGFILFLSSCATWSFIFSFGGIYHPNWLTLVTFPVVGLIFFIIKSEHGIFYGLVEIAFALFFVYHVYIQGNSSPEYSAAAAKDLGYFTILYVVIRGIDNINKASEKIENDKKETLYDRLKAKFLKYFEELF